MIAARNARAEATSLLPEGFEARVLEPSPPASLDPVWFADDPTDTAGATGEVVTPVTGEATSWSTLVDSHPHLAGFAADHWLGEWRRLQPLPAQFEDTRRALHQLAFFVLAPTRFNRTGKLGLRYTYRGFGTSFFGDDEQVRIEGDRLVLQRGMAARSAPITTLAKAAAFVDIAYEELWFEGFHDQLESVGPDRQLAVDPVATDALGDLFGFSASVLEQARRTPGAADVSRVQLWPEHFDVAFEMGTGDHRASYGLSPGDEAHPEPYLYVAAWGPIDRSDPYWNDSAFNGSSLSYRQLLAASDQRVAALDFLRSGYERLAQ